MLWDVVSSTTSTSVSLTERSKARQDISAVCQQTCVGNNNSRTRQLLQACKAPTAALTGGALRLMIWQPMAGPAAERGSGR